MSTTDVGKPDDFTLSLAGQSLHFRYGLSAFGYTQEVLRADFELLGRTHVPTAIEIQQGVNQGHVMYLRAMIFGGTRKYQPSLTMADIDQLLETASESEIHTLLRAFGLSVTPNPQDLEALGVKPNGNRARPQTARTSRRKTGTGADSISTPAASA